jgi:hypothetical protein
MTAITQYHAIIHLIPAPQAVRVNMMRFLPEIIQFSPTNRTAAVLAEAGGGDCVGGENFIIHLGYIKLITFSLF